MYVLYLVKELIVSCEAIKLLTHILLQFSIHVEFIHGPALE